MRVFTPGNKISINLKKKNYKDFSLWALCLLCVLCGQYLSYIDIIFYHRVHRGGTEYHRDFIISYTIIKPNIERSDLHSQNHLNYLPKLGSCSGCINYQVKHHNIIYQKHERPDACIWMGWKDSGGCAETKQG